jgi:hypothetical protein
MMKNFVREFLIVKEFKKFVLIIEGIFGDCSELFWIVKDF